MKRGYQDEEQLDGRDGAARSAQLGGEPDREQDAEHDPPAGLEQPDGLPLRGRVERGEQVDEAEVGHQRYDEREAREGTQHVSGQARTSRR